MIIHGINIKRPGKSLDAIFEEVLNHLVVGWYKVKPCDVEITFEMKLPILLTPEYVDLTDKVLTREGFKVISIDAQGGGTIIKFK